MAKIKIENGQQVTSVTVAQLPISENNSKKRAFLKRFLRSFIF